MSSNSNIENPCEEFGSTQRWALVWFVSALIIGIALTYKLSQVDRWMYAHNGEMLNYDAYRANRLAATSIPDERIDPRQKGSYSATVQNLEN